MNVSATQRADLYLTAWTFIFEQLQIFSSCAHMLLLVLHLAHPWNGWNQPGPCPCAAPFCLTSLSELCFSCSGLPAALRKKSGFQPLRIFVLILLPTYSISWYPNPHRQHSAQTTLTVSVVLLGPEHLKEQPAFPTIYRKADFPTRERGLEEGEALKMRGAGGGRITNEQDVIYTQQLPQINVAMMYYQYLLLKIF